ncbi:MAG: hypothetical protein ACK5Y2_14015 [Bdellovibrionales bacterium]
MISRSLAHLKLLRWGRWFVASLILSSLAFGFLSDLQPETSFETKIYPFWSFRLFATYNKNTFIYKIYLTEVGGVKQDPPVDMAKYFQQINRLRNFNPTRQIHRLAEMKKEVPHAEFTRLFNEFLENFLLFSGSLRGYLVLEQYDPIERWHTGKILSSETIYEF